MTSLTILICTHNRVDLLKRTIDYLNNSKRTSHLECSILVVANACTDGTHNYLDAYTKALDPTLQLPLSWVKEPKPGKSNALNLAISIMQSEYVTFVDDDHRVSTDYLVEIEKAIEMYPMATMFCGRILPDWDGTEPEWIHSVGPYAIYPLPVPRYDNGQKPVKIGIEGPTPGGGNLFLSTRVFNRVGNFSTKLGPTGHNLAGGEDSEFVHRAIKHGEYLQYAPSVVQHHYVDLSRLTLTYIILKAFQRSYAVTRLQANTRIPPRYMWGKALRYFFNAITSLYWPEIRFYLVRTAASLGEIKAYLFKA